MPPNSFNSEKGSILRPSRRDIVFKKKILNFVGAALVVAPQGRHKALPLLKNII
jgi:hypothetical protein